MESVEVSAKTVEEAVELALERLETTLSEVEVEVLSRGRAGILGFGAEDARVRVTRLGAPSQVGFLAKELVEGLLRAMHIRASVNLRAPDDSGPLALDIKGNDLGILIGRRGETLASLQYLLNLMLSRRLKSRTAVTLDVEGYRQRREEALHNLARRMAERVRATGQAIALEPMPARERRIVHLALAEDGDVTTQSAGEGEDRKVVIVPRTGTW